MLINLSHAISASVTSALVKPLKRQCPYVEEQPQKKQKFEDSIRNATVLAEKIKVLSKTPSVENNAVCFNLLAKMNLALLETLISKTTNGTTMLHV